MTTCKKATTRCSCHSSIFWIASFSRALIYWEHLTGLQQAYQSCSWLAQILTWPSSHNASCWRG
jgi:hypothetical protein